IVSKWSNADKSGYCLSIGESGDLELWLGDGKGQAERVSIGKAFHPERWYFVAATYDAANRKVALYQMPLTNWPGDTSAGTTESTVKIGSIGTNNVPLLIGAAHP